MDIPDARVMAELVRPGLEERGYKVFEISAVTHEGLRPLSFAMAELVKSARADLAPLDMARIVISPKPVNEVGFVVVAEDDGFRVRGERPERWVRQTDFGNEEAVGYLADRLARLGVEDELVAKGALPGCSVMIGPEDNAVVFDWHPTILAGAGPNQGPRGTDVRVDLLQRDSVDE